MKEILKYSGKTLIKLVLVNIMCIVLAVSLAFVSTDLFGKQIGYTAICTSEDGKTTENYVHNFKDGEDLLKAEYEAKGFTVKESYIKRLQPAADTAVLLTIQLLCLILTASLLYPEIWHFGFKNLNAVSFKREKEDKLKGLKIGLFAIIPAVIALLFIFITKDNILKGFPIAYYRLANAFSYGFSGLICGDLIYANELNILQYLGMLSLQAIIPIITTFAYLLGYKNISISEKLIYKKNKQEN
ncbi:MAG: hypothetical protein IKT38_06930 [Clostridia bacterium]|nr:hypothetical protein [Clostridia bacterium]